MNPGTLLTDVCDFHHVRIQAGLLYCLSECRLMHSWRTGTDDNACQMMLFDGLNDQVLSAFRTHILIVGRICHTRFLAGSFCNSFYVYCSCNIASAPTYKYTYFMHVLLPPSYIFGMFYKKAAAFLHRPFCVTQSSPSHELYLLYFLNALTMACCGSSGSNMQGTSSAFR